MSHQNEEYLKSDLDGFYKNIFLKTKEKRKDGYFKDDRDLLELIKPLIWKMSVPKIAIELDVTARMVDWCIRKNNLDRPGKNYWQTNK